MEDATNQNPMAPTESPQNRHVPLLPFIIALLLVKSKPSNLLGSDFRKQMASYIENGPRSNHSPEVDAHVNIRAFWHNRSNQLEEEKATFEAKVSQLQAKISQLQARVSELEAREILWKSKSPEVEDLARSQRLKRRRDGEPAEKPSRCTKRARRKISAVALNERDAVLQDLISNETGSEWDELGNNLLRSLRNLQGSPIARKGNPLGPKDLALKLSTIATDICRQVSAIDLPANLHEVPSTTLLGPTPRSKKQLVTYPQTEPEDLIEQRLTPIGRTLPHFLVHLRTLSQIPGSENLYRQVEDRFIDAFRVLFQRICDLAVADVKSNQDRPRTTEWDGGRKKQPGTIPLDERPATSPIIMKLCKLAISMLFHLDAIQSTHKSILERCLYLLVTRVGEVLKAFTIGERPFGIQEDDTTSRHDPSPQEGQQLKITSAASEVEASEAQAPYLIWILDRTQRFSSSVSSATKATITSHDVHRQIEIAQPDSSHSTTYDDARIRLQHTLLNALFGAAARFEPALESPHALPDDELMTGFETQSETADVRDWFKNEVWRLIGWDVLRGNIACD